MENERRKSWYERYLKRTIDVAVAVGVVAITWPVMIVVAVGVRVFHGRPVIFRQRRVTVGGNEFVMYKFKSMRDACARSRVSPLFHTDNDDPRHTPFGRFIRRFSLDELPQIANVLRGEMSLIGPRPELPEVCATYDLFDHPRHLVRPGLTGPWQVSSNRHSFVHLNTHLDTDYVQDLTFRRDAAIAMKTFGVLAIGKRRPRVAQDDAHELIAGKRPLRVLHVLEPATGGVPVYVDQLGAVLRERKIGQVVITSDRSEWSFDWADEVVRLPWNRSRPRETVAVGDAIRRMADHHHVDIVHAHATFAGVAARVRAHPARVVYQPHGWGHLSTQAQVSRTLAVMAERALAKRTDLLLTLSRQEDAESPALVRRERVRPLPDRARFAPPTDEERAMRRAQFGWTDDERIHLCVGELSTRKNQVELTDSFTRLAPDGHRLVLIGEGAVDPQIPTKGLSKIDRLGWRDDIVQLMQAADSLLISSRGEGFSLVVLEALATGLPVFTTDIGGAEVLGDEDGAVSHLVDDVVRSATTSPLLSSTQADRAHRAKRHDVSFDEVGDEFVELYESLFPARRLD